MSVLNAKPSTPAKARWTMEVIADLKPDKVPSRKLDKLFMELYDIRVAFDPATREPTHLFFPRYIDGKLASWKVKDMNGTGYMTVGPSKGVDMFGQNLDGGRRLCIVTEGELDAVAAKQMLANGDNHHGGVGKDYRVVSLPNGSLSKLNKGSFEFLGSFETVILALDMDEAGDHAVENLSTMLGASCKRAMLPSKDANDCLVAGQGKEFVSAINGAKAITQDGMVMASDTWDMVLNGFNGKDNGIPFPWDCLNEKTYGSRLGELDTITSGTGMGKSAVCRELIHHWSMTHDTKTGVLFLEEGADDTMLGQMSLVANKPLHLPEVRAAMDEAELREYWEAVSQKDNIVLYDHFGSVKDDTLMSKLRYMASGMGCKYIILDHLSIVVSEFANDGDERKNIDSLMTKLKRLTEELKIHITIVSHLRKADGKSFEEGGVPTLNHLRGSGSIAQLSHQVYALSRNQQAVDPRMRNTTQMHVLKNRFCGRTGPAGLVEYVADTGRLVPSTMTQDEYNGDVGVLDRQIG